jgi:uncharacterized lipoprotein YddW (UPF0748 family)
MKSWLTAAGVALALTGAHLTAQEAAPAGTTGAARTQWVQQTSLQSPESIRRMVTTAATNGVDALYVPIRASRPPGFDAVAETIAAARERGMRVYAWISVNMVSGASEVPASRDHVIYQRPDWLMVPRELAPELFGIDVRSPEYLGRLARWTRANVGRVGGLFVSPLHAGAHQQLADYVKDIVTRYPVDGVHLDDVRFPGADFDYSRAAVDAFRASVRTRLSPVERARLDSIETIDPFAYPDELAEEWRLFRQTQMTALVTRLRSTAKAVRPGIVVSASVVSDVVRAARDGFQDWRTWLDNGFVDALRPVGGQD